MVTRIPTKDLKGDQGESVAEAIQPAPGKVAFELTDGTTTRTVDLPRGEQGLPGVNATPSAIAVAGYMNDTSADPATNPVPSALAKFDRVDGSTRVWNAAAIGAKGNGIVNDTAVLQGALDALEAAGGGTLVIPAGFTCKITQLLLGSGTTLDFRGATLIRTGLSSGGSGGATLRNKDQANGNSNIRIYGGTITAATAADTGKHFAFTKVTNLNVGELYIGRPWGDWAFLVTNCTGIRIGHLQITGAQAIFEDGLHITGCQNMVVGTLDVEAGDDCVAVVQASNATQASRNISIGRVIARSHRANLLKLEVAADGAFGISGVVIGEFVGDKSVSTAGNCIKINDLSQQKLIKNVIVANLQLDASQSFGAAALISYATDITLDNVIIESPEGVGIDVDHVDRIRMRGCVVRGTRATGISGIRMRACTEYDLDACQVISATSHGFVIGSASLPSSDGSVRNSLARSCTGNGIHLDSATATDVTGNRVKGCAWGIREEVGGAGGNYITGNDVRGNTSTISAAAGDYNGTYRDGNVPSSTWHTLTPNSATPTVIGGNRLHTTANTAATSVLNLSNPSPGQEVVIVVNDSNTRFVYSSASFKLAGAVSWDAPLGAVLRMAYIGSRWVETGRSIN